MARQVTAGITTYRRPAALARLLDSIERHWPELNVEVQDTGGNLSWGRNQLIGRCPTEFFLLLEDDFEFSPQTDLTALLAVLRADGDLAGVGGSVIENGLVRHWCHNFDPFRKKARLVPSWDPWGFQIADCRLQIADERRQDGFATALLQSEIINHKSEILPYRPCQALLNFGIFRRDVLRENPWDEGLPINGEHREWYYRLWRSGQWRFAWTPAATILHHRVRPPGYQTDRSRSFIKQAEAKHGIKLAAPKTRMKDEGGRMSQQPSSSFILHPSSFPSPRPNIVVLGVGHANTSITTRQLFALGWHPGDADEEFAESTSIRTLNQRLLQSEIINLKSEMHTALAAIPQPWAIKDPRFVFTLPAWLPAFAPYEPLLLWITKDSRKVAASYVRRGKSPEQAARLVSQRESRAASHFQSWPWAKLQLDATQIRAAIALFDLTR